jgi:hypothetical protein
VTETKRKPHFLILRFLKKLFQLFAKLHCLFAKDLEVLQKDSGVFRESFFMFYFSLLSLYKTDCGFVMWIIIK